MFWPCAPDGYIPNSVVRQKVKPRRPPAARLIARVKQPMKKLPYTEDKEEQEIEEGRAKIRGNHYVSNYLRKKSTHNHLWPNYCTLPKLSERDKALEAMSSLRVG